MSLQKKITEEYKLEIKELFNEVSSRIVKLKASLVAHVKQA